MYLKPGRARIRRAFRRRSSLPQPQSPYEAAARVNQARCQLTLRLKGGERDHAHVGAWLTGGAVPHSEEQATSPRESAEIKTMRITTRENPHDETQKAAQFGQKKELPATSPRESAETDGFETGRRGGQERLSGDDSGPSVWPNRTENDGESGRSANMAGASRVFWGLRIPWARESVRQSVHCDGPHRES